AGPRRGLAGEAEDAGTDHPVDGDDGQRRQRQLAAPGLGGAAGRRWRAGLGLRIGHRRPGRRGGAMLGSDVGPAPRREPIPVPMPNPVPSAAVPAALLLLSLCCAAPAVPAQAPKAEPLDFDAAVLKYREWIRRPSLAKRTEARISLAATLDPRALGLL